MKYRGSSTYLIIIGNAWQLVRSGKMFQIESLIIRHKMQRYIYETQNMTNWISAKTKNKLEFDIFNFLHLSLCTRYTRGILLTFSFVLMHFFPILIKQIWYLARCCLAVFVFFQPEQRHDNNTFSIHFVDGRRDVYLK